MIRLRQPKIRKHHEGTPSSQLPPYLFFPRYLSTPENFRPGNFQLSLKPEPMVPLLGMSPGKLLRASNVASRARTPPRTPAHYACACESRPAPSRCHKSAFLIPGGPIVWSAVDHDLNARGRP